jgi:hypothetical protein
MLFALQRITRTLNIIKHIFAIAAITLVTGNVVDAHPSNQHSGAGTGRPCSEIDGSSPHYSRQRTHLRFGAGALDRIRSCGPGITFAEKIETDDPAVPGFGHQPENRVVPDKTADALCGDLH